MSEMEKFRAQHVLVVDDEPIVGELLKEALNMFGHSVQVGLSGEEALKLMEQTHFDMVFTDYRMPGMLGDALAQAIKARCPEIPVILISGSPPDSLPPCVDSMLLKPFRLHELGQIVAQWANNPPAEKTTSS